MSASGGKRTFIQPIDPEALETRGSRPIVDGRHQSASETIGTNASQVQLQMVSGQKFTK
jgi:hypothetical protein